MKRVVEILDKHFDQEAFLKEMAMELIAPKIAEFKAKVQSGEVDPIKGTNLDNQAIIMVIEAIEKQLAG